jgi:hypothetical protein
MAVLLALADRDEGVVVDVGGVLLAVLLAAGLEVEAGGVERSLGEVGFGSEEVLILVRGGGVESILECFLSLVLDR